MKTLTYAFPLPLVACYGYYYYSVRYVLYLLRYLFIYLFKINDRKTRGPLILPEVHKNTQNTQHKLNKGKKQTNKHK